MHWLLLSFLVFKLVSSQDCRFTNPIVYDDLPDLEIVRVGNEYFMSSSTFHYSPGGAILKSTDLIKWEYIGHSVPRLDDRHDMVPDPVYVGGMWASGFGYRPATRDFYWGACIMTHPREEFLIYTAQNPAGEWKQTGTLPCINEPGFLFDDDDTMYIAHGARTIHVSQVAPDGQSIVRDELVYTWPEDSLLEGARFYKRNGFYYIWLTRAPNAQFVLRANNPFGPYDIRNAVDRPTAPIPGADAPHQGALVSTPNDQWYYVGFADAFPGGRIPAMAPVTWIDDWPVVELVNGNEWALTYPCPSGVVNADQASYDYFRDDFWGTTLRPEWEWNHNPDDSKWNIMPTGLRMETADVNLDIYRVRNTLTRRIRGPASNATVMIEYSSMKVGDRAGLAIWRDDSGWIGVVKDPDGVRLSAFTNVNIGPDLKSAKNLGEETDSIPLPSTGRLWLRAHADIQPGLGRLGTFSYSLDGFGWLPLEGSVTLNTNPFYFTGYRWALFNYATSELGGSVVFSHFEQQVE